MKENDPENPLINKMQKKLDGTKRQDVYDKFANDEIGLDEFIDTV